MEYYIQQLIYKSQSVTFPPPTIAIYLHTKKNKIPLNGERFRKNWEIKLHFSPDWCGSTGWGSMCKVKGCQLHSWSRAHAWVVGSVSGQGD